MTTFFEIVYSYATELREWPRDTIWCMIYIPTRRGPLSNNTAVDFFTKDSTHQQ